MARVIIITNPELAVGFRLAGVTTLSADTPDEAAAIVEPLLEAGADASVIGVHDPYLKRFPARLLRRFEQQVVPVVLGLPEGGEPEGSEARRARIAEVLGRAIGHRMSFGARKP